MQVSVAQLIVDLVRQQVDISAINLFRPKMSEPIQNDSGLSRLELQLIDQALALRSATAFPFWDCLLQLTSNSTAEGERLLQIAQRHNPQAQSIERLAREYVEVAIFEDKISNLQSGEVLAISSRVECVGRRGMHFPMLDFHCKISSINDKRVRLIVKSLDLRGYIVHSGQSYHFYGSELLPIEDLLTMLARELLFAPIIDRTWVAHQIIERACGLRISAGKTYPQPPIVVDQV